MVVLARRGGRFRWLCATLTLLLSAAGVLAGGEDSEAQGCRLSSPDRLLTTSVFSSLQDERPCEQTCGDQKSLLAVFNSRWCFCFNKLTLPGDPAPCNAQPKSGDLELFQLRSVTSENATDLIEYRTADGWIHLSFDSCVSGPVDHMRHEWMVDPCVQTCHSQHYQYVVLGSPKPTSNVYYDCACSNSAHLGAVQTPSFCNFTCFRDGQEALEIKCGGRSASNAPLFSVYRILSDDMSTTSPSVTTGLMTSDAGGCMLSEVCGSGRKIGNSCYVIQASFDSYDEAADACSLYDSAVWSIEEESEQRDVYLFFQNQPDCFPGYSLSSVKLLTSARVRSGTYIVWKGLPGEPRVDAWFSNQLNDGAFQVGAFVVIANLALPYDQRTLQVIDERHFKDENALFVLCEKHLDSPTTTLPTTPPTPSPTEASSTPDVSTEPATDSTDSSTVPSTSTEPPKTTESTTNHPTSSPAPTPEPTTSPSTSSSATSTTGPVTTTPSPTPDDQVKSLLEELDNSRFNISGQDVVNAVDQLDGLVEEQRAHTAGMTPGERLDSDTQFSWDFVRLVDALLSARQAWSDNMTQPERVDTGSKLREGVENAGFLLADSTAHAQSDRPLELQQKTLTMSASSRSRSSDNSSLTFPSYRGSGAYVTLKAGYHHFVDLPNAVDRLQQVGVLYTVQTVALMMPTANSSEPTKSVNSPVIGFSLGSAGQSVQLDSDAVSLSLRYFLPAKDPLDREVWRHLYPGELPSAVPDSAVCRYWDPTLVEWRRDGCRLVADSTTRQSAVCSCDHLTSFAVLMDYHDYVGTPLSLSVMTLILGSASMICLILTWIVFTCNRSLRCCRTAITSNLSAIYAVGLALVLTVMDRQLVYLGNNLCTAVGIAIHYCFLSVFAWTLVEGLHLYKVLRHVFEPKSNSMTRYYLYGYLGPVLIVVVTNLVALGTGQYAYVREEFCWLTSPWFIWFFTGPVALVLLMNVLVMVLAFRSASSLKVNQLRARKQKVKRWMRGWFSLSCLLGVQWTVGYLYIGGSNVFDYIFTALNCSQGVLIFVFHCLLRTRTRQLLLGRLSSSSRGTKTSNMMNSVYGHMVMAQKRSRQSRLSRDTSLTNLSSRLHPAGSMDSSQQSSPSSDRSCSTSEVSCSKARARRQSSGAASQLSRQVDLGRVNPAFQADEPWSPLPDISEELESRERELESSVSCQQPLPHTDSVEMYRSHSAKVYRHGRIHP